MSLNAVTLPNVRSLSMVEESRLLGDALRALRQERDGLTALRTLDLYERRFPDGKLHREAELARVDALLLVGRRVEALGLLDARSLDALPRSIELRVTRGELRLETGRASDAKNDFDVALVSAHGDLADRALYGRAGARGKMGDFADARADLEEYLRRFPAGRHAAEARAAIERGK